jgi:hypothetical protein
MNRNLTEVRHYSEEVPMPRNETGRKHISGIKSEEEHSVCRIYCKGMNSINYARYVLR